MKVGEGQKYWPGDCLQARATAGRPAFQESFAVSLPFFRSGVPMAARVGVLAAIAVIAVAVLSLTHYLGDRGMSAALDRLSDNRALQSLAASVANETLQMRRREKDFLLRRDEAEAQRYGAAVATALAELGAMADLDAAAPVRARIDTVRSEVAAHRDQFAKVVESYRVMGFDEKSGLQGDLRAAVHAVETRLKAADLDALTVKMLMMRRHEKDLMLRGDMKYVGEVDARRAEFDALLAASPLGAAEQAEIARLMDAYVGGFKGYATIDATIDAETGVLSDIFGRLTPEVEAVEQAAEAGLAAAEADLAATRSMVSTVFVASAVATLVIALGLAWVLGRGITRPVIGLTGAMRSLADGDTSVEIPDASRHLEIGAMASAVEVFRANAIRNRELEAQQAENEKRAAAEKRAAMEQLAREFDDSVGRIVGMITQASHDLSSASQTMATLSEDVDTRSASVAAASEQTAANVHTVAAATEEMNASISEISAQILRTSTSTQQAADEILRTSGQMEALTSVANRIGEVVSLISGIAAQTNLLALNASIESARAGEAGKGFAVVAGEVKALAGETAKATDGISGLVAEIQAETRNAVAAIDGIGRLVSDINGTATAIAAAMEEQGAATREVSRNVVEAASGSRAVSDGISGVSIASRENRNAVTTVTAAAETLSGQSDEMRREVERFLAHIRNAA